MERYTPKKQDVIQEEEETDPVEIGPGVEDKKEEKQEARKPEHKINEGKGYTDRLENKLRELAAKLHEQESYKLLCERKLLELAPGHPLPIKPSYLGKSMAPLAATSGRQLDRGKLEEQIQGKDKKILALQQQINKLQSENERYRVAGRPPYKSEPATEEEKQSELAGKVTLLEKEKATLEESLRSEVLVNEEQRNYIEILKEALEAKIADLGLESILAKSQAKGKDSADIFAELTVMKKELDEQRKDIVKSESDREDMEGLIIDLKKENDTLKEELQKFQLNYANSIKENNEAQQLLEELSEKYEKIQKDNDALLDYAEENEENKKDTHREMASITDHCKALEEELNKKEKELQTEQKKVNKELQEKIKLEGDLKCKEANESHLTQRNKILEDQLTNLKQELESAQQEQLFNKEKIQNLEAINAQHISEISELNRLSAHQKEDIKEKNLLLDRADDELQNCQSQLIQSTKKYKEEISDLNRMITSLKNTQKEKEEAASKEFDYMKNKLEKQKDSLQNDVNSLEEAEKKQQEQIQILSTKNAELGGQNAQLSSHIDYLTTNLSEAQTELEKILEAYEEANKKSQDLEGELLLVKMKTDQQLQTLKDSEAELQLENQRLATQNERIKRQLEDDINTKLEEIRLLKQDISAISEARDKERAAKSAEISEAHEAARSSKAENSKLRSDLNMLRDENAMQNEENEKMKKDLNTKITELTDLHKTHDLLLDAHHEIETELNRSKIYLSQANRSIDEKSSEINELQIQISLKNSELNTLKQNLKENEVKLEETERNLFGLKAKYSSLEAIKSTLSTDNSDLSVKLSSEKTRNVSLTNEIKKHTAELEELHNKAFQQQSDLNRLLNESKEMQDEIAELHSFIDNISKYQDDVNKKYDQVILPIFQTHSDIFNAEISSYKFPLLKSDNVADKILNWFDSHRLWTTLLGDQLEALIEMVKTYQIEQSHSQTDMANIIDQNKQYSQDLRDTRNSEATLMAENKAIQESLIYTQQKLEDIQKEAQTLEESRDFLKKSETEAKSRYEAVLEQNVDLNAANQALQKELKDWMCTAESNGTLIESLENKIRQIASEKRDFELLLTRVYASIPSSEMQKVIGDMTKTQKELHIAQRELLTNSQATKSALEDLRASSQDPNSYDRTRLAQKNLEKYEEANERLRQNIVLLKNKLSESNIDLKEIESSARNAPLNISIPEPSLPLDASILSSRRISPARSEDSSKERQAPYPAATYGDKARQAELNAFANTLTKVKQSLRKYGPSSIHH